MKSITTQALVITLALAICGRFAMAQIPVTDDAFTSSTASSANYGTSLGLVVQSPTASGSMLSPAEGSGYTANTYLKFDLSALASNVTAGNLAKANLRLYVDYVVSPGTFDIYLAGGSWTESTLTAANAPGKVGTPINSSPISVSKALKYIDIDVTAAEAAWLNGTANNGLVLVPSAGSNIFVSFDSKENPLTAHDPQLSVSVNDASSTQLQQEINRATQAENTISSNLSNEVIRAEGAEGSITQGLNSEILRATSVEGALAGGLAAEITNRMNGDTAIQNSLSNYAQLGIPNKFSANQTITADLSANNITAAGALTAAGGAVLPALQTATASQGFPSNPVDLAASVSDGANAHNETFRWQAAPVNNGMPSFAAQLNLLYGGGVAPSTTIFSINADGTQNFATNQTFNGQHQGDGSGLRNVTAVSANIANNATFATSAASATMATTAMNFTGSLSGDVTGSQAGTTVAALRGVPLSTRTPQDGQVLGYSATARQWQPIAATASGPTCSSANGCVTVVTASSSVPPPGCVLSGQVLSGDNWVSINGAFGNARDPQSPDRAVAGVGLNGLFFEIENGQQLVSGGTAVAGEVKAFDPANPANGWQHITDVPDFSTNAVTPAAAVAVNGKMYVVNGSSLQVYDPASNSWTSKQSLPIAVNEIALAVIGTTIYAIGENGSNPLQAYDTINDTWSSLPFLPLGAGGAVGSRSHFGAAAVNGKLYVLGGCCGPDQNASTGRSAPPPLNTIEVYDSATNSWTEAGTVLQAGTADVAAVAINGDIYLLAALNGGISELYHPPSRSDSAQRSGGPTSTEGSQTIAGPSSFGGAAAAIGNALYAIAFAGVDSIPQNPGFFTQEFVFPTAHFTFQCGNTCSSDQTVCENVCTNTTSDVNNCGICGNICAQGSTCTNGTCSCSTGEMVCGLSCADLRSDANNCGGCGNVCPTGIACANATCQCAGGLAACITHFAGVTHSSCANLQTDNINCGSCGNLCFGGTQCNGGQCLPPSLLGGNCTIDSQCASGLVCTSGICLGGPGNACGFDEDCASGNCNLQTLTCF